MGVSLRSIWGAYKAHLIIASFQLWLAINMIMLQSVLSTGISGLVLVVYEHAISTCVLIPLAFFLEKGKRPPISFRILGYSFGLALLMISLCQMLLILSLQYVTATYESIALNVMPMIVFVMAVLFGIEELHFGTVHGQAKMWGVLFSVAGALTMVLWTGPTLFKSTLTTTKASFIGGIMLVVGTLGGASWNLLVGQVTRMYPAEISLSAMMSFFGTIQTAVIAGFLVTGSSWKLKWEGGLVLITILWGGILVTGLFYYAQTWSVHKKGPVFTTAFQPLLIVFSFILEAAVLKESTHLGSIIGAVLVVLGLYMLLWGKSKDQDKEGKGILETDGNINSPLII
ncbi:hypothetical protein MRB53_013237 [Persea americana]|uniref:Uncharacterized protein n=1 Tax=Persea americana TaxID=3435 RepID=A0ACC2K7I1_PERAE|nr:hypothetical protein MRB53_013237 [Persea americana]